MVQGQLSDVEPASEEHDREVFIELNIKSIKYTKTTLFETVSFFASSRKKKGLLKKYSSANDGIKRESLIVIAAILTCIRLKQCSFKGGTNYDHHAYISRLMGAQS